MKFAELLTIALALASSSVLAAGEDSVARINERTGSILASSGSEGEFVPVEIGHALKADDRVMVTEGAKVTVRYDNDCAKTFDEPGVYTIESRCVQSAGMASSSTMRWAVPVAVVGLGIAWYEHNRDDSSPVSR